MSVLAIRILFFLAVVLGVPLAFGLLIGAGMWVQYLTGWEPIPVVLVTFLTPLWIAWAVWWAFGDLRD